MVSGVLIRGTFFCTPNELSCLVVPTSLINKRVSWVDQSFTSHGAFQLVMGVAIHNWMVYLCLFQGKSWLKIWMMSFFVREHHDLKYGTYDCGKTLWRNGNPHRWNNEKHVPAGVGFYVPIFHITQLLGIFHLQQIFVLAMWNKTPKVGTSIPTPVFQTTNQPYIGPGRLPTLSMGHRIWYNRGAAICNSAVSRMEFCPNQVFSLAVLGG